MVQQTNLRERRGRKGKRTRTFSDNGVDLAKFERYLIEKVRVTA